MELFERNMQISNASKEIGSNELEGLPVWKRILDFVLILILLPGLALIATFLSIMIKAGSKGRHPVCHAGPGFPETGSPDFDAEQCGGAIPSSARDRFDSLPGPDDEAGC